MKLWSIGGSLCFLQGELPLYLHTQRGEIPRFQVFSFLFRIGHPPVCFHLPTESLFAHLSGKAGWNNSTHVQEKYSIPTEFLQVHSRSFSPRRVGVQYILHS